MWNRDDASDKKPLKAPENRAASGRPATVGSSIAVRGELVGREDLTIDGTFEGEIKVTGCLVTIGASGQVAGVVRAKTIAVEGSIRGNLIAEDQIVIRASGRMEGDIQAPRVALDEGCQFRGNIDMEPNRKKETPENAAQSETPEAAAQEASPPAQEEESSSEEDGDSDQKPEPAKEEAPSDDSKNSSGRNRGRNHRNRRR